MAFLGLKVLGGIATGIKKLGAKIRAKKEAKIQKRIDAAVNKQNYLSGIFGGTPGIIPSIPDANSIRASAENLLGIKPAVANDSTAEGTTLGGMNSGLPSWLLPVVGLVALVLLLPRLMGRKRR